MFMLLLLGVIILIKLKKEVPITLEEACVTMSMGQANFSPERWLSSIGLGKTTNS